MDNLIFNINIITDLINHNSIYYKYIPNKYKYNNNIICNVLKKNGLIFKYLPNELKSNKFYQEIALYENKYSIKFNI